MFQRSLNLRTIYNLSIVKKSQYCLSHGFCSKSSNDDSSNEPSKESDSKEEPVKKLLDDAASFEEINNTDWATTPYPASAAQSLMKDEKPKIDPSERSVILFPGQGIIKVGQVKEYLKFPKVKELFEIANEILGYNLLKICLKGPKEMLNRTEFNQPATVVTSLAALEKLQEERPRAVESVISVAGYSVGELTALIFAGAMPYEEGLRLVGVRATAMQAASEISPQGMLSAYCLPEARASKICEEAEKWAMDIGAPYPLCKVAIYPCTNSKIFGGSIEALQYIEKNSRTLGLRKLQRLPVSGAFHTALMEPALKSFIKGLNKTPLSEPIAYVYSNFSGNVYTQHEKYNRKILTKQMVSPVKWEQIMHKIYERPEGTKFPRTFDVGSKGSLKTILKVINLKAADSCYVY